MEVNMLPLGRDRTVRLDLEEFESASKPASLFATPQQETIWQTYLGGCDADVCLFSRLNSMHIALSITPAKEMWVWVGAAFSSAPSIGARIPLSMYSTHQPTSFADAKRM